VNLLGERALRLAKHIHDFNFMPPGEVLAAKGVQVGYGFGGVDRAGGDEQPELEF
jgi:hypothetical protein